MFLINGNGPTVTLSQHKFPFNLMQAMTQHKTVDLKQNEAITSNGIMLLRSKATWPFVEHFSRGSN